MQWQQDLRRSAELADIIHDFPRHEQKALLIEYDAKIEVQDDSIEVTFTKDGITTTIAAPAKLVRRGNELRLALPPDHLASGESNVDSTLVRLVAQGFAASEHVVAGKYYEQVGTYDRKHLLRLARVAWLAPDIISAILDGKQPIQLTARHLLRCSHIPMEWQQQRSFLGFR